MISNFYFIFVLRSFKTTLFTLWSVQSYWSAVSYVDYKVYSFKLNDYAWVPSLRAPHPSFATCTVSALFILIFFHFPFVTMPVLTTIYHLLSDFFVFIYTSGVFSSYFCFKPFNTQNLLPVNVWEGQCGCDFKEKAPHYLTDRLTYLRSYQQYRYF